MKHVFILLSILLLFTSCDYFTYDKYGKRSVAKDNFQGIDSLQLKGVVYDLKSTVRGFHGRGILRLNIIETNIDFYDPREQQANYFCIIKDGKAEVYDQIASRLNIGDTVYIDVSKNKLWIEDINDNIKFTSISIGPRQFFRRIKERGYQEF